ncbi:HD family phosphohydrolase [Natranaerofaba carboxydovora]|uniref:HD family phosphohydrolase n=1 Tax=Natranaerofaba carboxydovora TaxID=2742683 RepID=UPI001F143F24|nr:HD family phosphohydrolase [Natranaerofaba carboxydovora]UMZ74962.1 3'3'-cGAMP-specific phosphodiesterase 3 [Natranaerofaba carboxydovora]
MSNPGKIHSEVEKQLKNFLSIGIALSAEKDHNKLMEMILNEARRITGADAGTLYLAKENELSIEIIHNDTMNTYKGGTSNEEADLPPVPLEKEYVSGYVALTGKSVNIADVYEDKNFDFTGPQKYDRMTGYRTKSMLVIPLKNHLDEVIGVLQLINALDQGRDMTSFSQKHETIVKSLASLAAISLTNQQLIEEIENLFESFVQVMVTAIENKTPYNASHTEKVSKLAVKLAKAVHNSNKEPFGDEFFEEDRLKQLEMSGWLHDIGKVSIPLSVMNKKTRLDESLTLVLTRINLAKEQAQKEKIEELITKNRDADDANLDAKKIQKECQAVIEKYDKILETIKAADNPDNFIDEDKKNELIEIANIKYKDETGEKKPLLTEEDLECLTVSKGTLTEDEKNIMQQHVDITEKILSKIPFTKKLSKVQEFSCMHHESLDGKGYPKGLEEEDIPLEARILAIADIYDALTASDRPYKKGIPVEKALNIMKSMVEEKKLDKDLYELFVEEKIYESY